jgi:hypothetical protein
MLPTAFSGAFVFVVDLVQDLILHASARLVSSRPLGSRWYYKHLPTTDGARKEATMILEIFIGSRDRNSFSLRPAGRIVAYLCMAFTICIALTSCGGDHPPAETPIRVDSGAWFSGTKYGEIPLLNLYSDTASFVSAVDDVIQPAGADYTMSFYITIKYRARTTLKASYNGVPIDWVDPPANQGPGP